MAALVADAGPAVTRREDASPPFATSTATAAKRCKLGTVYVSIMAAIDPRAAGDLVRRAGCTEDCETVQTEEAISELRRMWRSMAFRSVRIVNYDRIILVCRASAIILCQKRQIELPQLYRNIPCEIAYS